MRPLGKIVRRDYLHAAALLVVMAAIFGGALYWYSRGPIYGLADGPPPKSVPPPPERAR